MSRTPRAVRKHAIVSGGSMAGPLAARLLTDHFENVSWIEPDALPELAGSAVAYRRVAIPTDLLASGRNIR